MLSSHGEQFPIGPMYSLTGVDAVKLGAWEPGSSLPVYSYLAHHRLYTHAHVALIRRVLGFIESGVPMSQVGKPFDAAPESRVASDAPGPWRNYFDRSTAAIASLDEPELDQIYDEALSVHSTDDVTRHLILPLLAHLGECWKNIAGAVAEEHFVAMYLRRKLRPA